MPWNICSHVLKKGYLTAACLAMSEPSVVDGVFGEFKAGFVGAQLV